MVSEEDKNKTKFIGVHVPVERLEDIRKYVTLGIFRNNTDAVSAVLKYLPQAAEERRLSLVAIEVEHA